MFVRCAPAGAGVAFVIRADPVLRRGRVVVVLALRRKALLVVVEFRVLDRDPATGVRAGVTEVVVLGARFVDDRVAVRARADVVAGVRHVVGVGVREEAGPGGIRRVDAVLVGGLFLAAPIRRRRAQVFAPPGADRLFARCAAAVEPDRITAVVGAEKVARREVLQPHAARLVNDDPVVAEEAAAFRRAERLIRFSRAALRGARFRSVDHDGVPVHAADVQVRGGDEDGGSRDVVAIGACGFRCAFLFVVARCDQDPVTGCRCVDGFLDGFALTFFPFERADAQDAVFGRGQARGRHAAVDGRLPRGDTAEQNAEAQRHAREEAAPCCREAAVGAGALICAGDAGKRGHACLSVVDRGGRDGADPTPLCESKQEISAFSGQSLGLRCRAASDREHRRAPPKRGSPLADR